LAALQALEVKAKVMLLVTRNFLVDRTIGTLELLRQDGLTGPRVWARLFWCAFGNPACSARCSPRG
jgi:predicted metal-dependent hydrolase